jgi:signal transduction histidine kinase
VTQLAQTYNDLRSRLAKSWADQRQFVSAVSHELRTPLTIVQGYLHRTLKRGDNLSEAQRRGLRTAEDESVRMRHLLDDLLDLSRSDSGQLRINNEPVALEIAVSEAVSLARSSLERDIQLDLPNPDETQGLVALADPDRLRQVLLDLIENAHKYSPEGKPVTVRLRHDDNEAVVEVADQGIGIPEEDVPRVFERFHRAANASISSGSGLGLSIVQLLVEAMGGQVGVNSQLGEGSTFTVRLPFATVE